MKVVNTTYVLLFLYYIYHMLALLVIIHPKIFLSTIFATYSTVYSDMKRQCACAMVDACCNHSPCKFEYAKEFGLFLS